jgi:tRNA-binding protein
MMKPAPIKEKITIGDLERVDMRVGTIESIKEVPSSKKLMKLAVNFGDHSRTVLAGIKRERQNPADIVGLQALFVVNLPVRKMAGEVSEGMLLDIGYSDGLTPALAVPERAVPDGSRAG